MSFRFVLLCAIGVCAAASVAAEERWATYSNARFGTTVDYPIYLFPSRDPPPDNGDGQVFHTEDRRARLTIWGARNAEGDSAQGYFEKYGTQDAVSYRRVTARFYVVSGPRDSDIFYERCNFSAKPDGIIDCLSVTYPAQDKAAWDPIVSRLSESLRGGRGAEMR